MKIVIIDNYDSFTYNLAHLVKELGAEVKVVRNDQFEMSQLEEYDKIILSPGPGIPSEAGMLLDVIKAYAGKKPILGVCLGHQAIGEFFGGKLENLSEVYHGVATVGSVIETADSNVHTSEGKPCDANNNSAHTSDGKPCDAIFAGLSPRITMGRYHSWVVSNDDLPACLEVTAMSDEGQIMALRHREHNIRGIQFHPESVLTTDGRQMLSNWLTLC